MSGPAGTLRTVFIGGPGRSGTSFVAECLSRHPTVTAFRDVELKLFTEKGGLLDLWHSLGERYSPNRAVVAMRQFRKLIDALVEGQFGQPGLAGAAAGCRAAADTFCEGFARDGHPVRTDAAAFDRAARGLVADLAALAAGQQAETAPRPEVFLEKTPHALLAMDFLDRVAPGARFVHVMRDPRSIAFSLRRMRWGPDRLEGCATWVAAYCEAWLGAEARADALGLPLHRMHVEAIAAAPEPHAAALCRALDLAARPGLFGRADLATLNCWAERASAAERALLDDRLGGWAEHFGYRRDAIGRYPSSAPVDAPSSPAGPVAPAGSGDAAEVPDARADGPAA